MRFSVVLGIIMLVALVLVGAEPINISSGGVYNYTWVNQSSGSQDFLCLPNLTSCDVTTVVLNFSLNPGETREVQPEPYCKALVSCSTQGSSADSCVIDRSVKPGETFTSSAGSCNVKFRCEESEGEVTSSCDDFVEVKKPVRVHTDGNDILIEVDGNVQRIEDAANLSFSIEREYRLQCPIETVNRSILEGSDLLAFCKAQNPYLLEWNDQTLERTLEYQEALSRCESGRTSDKDQCNLDVLGVREQLQACQSARNQTSDRLLECQERVGDLENGENWITFILVGSAGLNGIFVLALIILAYLYMGMRRKHGGSV